MLAGGLGLRGSRAHAGDPADGERPTSRDALVGERPVLYVLTSIEHGDDLGRSDQGVEPL